MDSEFIGYIKNLIINIRYFLSLKYVCLFNKNYPEIIFSGTWSWADSEETDM